MRRCVVVLGAGRSGTSLLMNILQNAGMSVSEEMIPPSEQNHAGGFEDIEIFNLHSKLFSDLGTNQVFPLPERWMDSGVIPSYIEQLGEIVLSRIEASASIWGIKDPRMSTFLPLWIRIFNRYKIVPTYLLAVRSPGAVVRSLDNQYGIRPEVGELFWLQKNCDALSYTGGNCFVAHYEDWLNGKSSILRELLDYVGLSGADEKLLLKRIVNKKLNRSIFEPHTVKNKQVQELYAVLSAVRGNQVDSADVMKTVADCKFIMDSYKGWYIEGHNILKRKQVPAHSYLPEMKQVRSQLDSLQSEAGKIVQSIDALDGRLASVKELQGQSLEKDILLDKFKSKVSQLNEEGCVTEERIKAAIESKNYLEETLGKTKQELKEAKQLYSIEVQKIESLQSGFAESERLIQHYKELIQAVSNQNEKLETKLSRIYSEEEALHRAVHDCQKRNEQLVGENEELETELSRIYSGEEVLHSAVHDCQKRNEQLVGENEDLEAELIRIYSEEEALHRAVHDCQERNEQLLEENEKLLSEVEILSASFDTCCKKKLDDKQVLEESFADLTQQFDLAVTHKDSLQEALALHQHVIDELKVVLEDRSKQLSQLLYSRRIVALLMSLERDYRDILKSVRWKFGNVVVRSIEILLFRWRKTLVTQHMDALFKEIRQLSFREDVSSLRCEEYKNLSRKLEKDFDALFSSMRWRCGSRFVAIAECFLVRRTSGAKEHVRKVFNRVASTSLKQTTVDFDVDNIFSLVSSDTKKASGVGPVEHAEPDANDCQMEKQPAEVKNEDRVLVNIHKKLPKVSIVIPVFNKKEYLASCFSSIFENGYENVEVVCVDDCSTDNSRDIIREWAQKDKRVKPFFLPENSGASVARNYGIKNSQGEYIFFTDADDVLVSGGLAALVIKAEAFQSDIVRGKITGITDDGVRYPLAAEHLLHNRDAERVKWKEEESLWYYWYFTANLYRSSFLNEQRLLFPTSVRNEDPYFLCRCFLATKNITLYNDIVYQYRINAEQKSKTPSYSFLKGWSMGNYYITQLLQNSGVPYQYFLCHYPSLETHSKNIVKELGREQAMGLLKYVKLIFSKMNMEYLVQPKKQPWNRKKSFTPQYIELVENIQNGSVEDLYTYLQGQI